MPCGPWFSWCYTPSPASLQPWSSCSWTTALSAASDATSSLNRSRARRRQPLQASVTVGSRFILFLQLFIVNLESHDNFCRPLFFSSSASVYRTVMFFSGPQPCFISTFIALQHRKVHLTYYQTRSCLPASHKLGAA